MLVSQCGVTQRHSSIGTKVLTPAQRDTQDKILLGRLILVHVVSQLLLLHLHLLLVLVHLEANTKQEAKDRARRRDNYTNEGTFAETGDLIISRWR